MMHGYKIYIVRINQGFINIYLPQYNLLYCTLFSSIIQKISIVFLACVKSTHFSALIFLWIWEVGNVCVGLEKMELNRTRRVSEFHSRER